MTVSRVFLLLGTDEKEPEARRIEAGRLSADFAGGNLRTIRLAGKEVLRAISFLVRDRDWGTCEAEIGDLTVEEGQTGTVVRYSARFRSPDGALLDCSATINLNPDRLVFDARFTPDRDFETARAGFAVLHPIVGLAGRPVEVEHVDGTV